MPKDCAYWYFIYSNREIPEDVLVLHEIHCQRYLYLCEPCKKVFPKTKKQSHDTEFHAKTKCSYCDQLFENMEMTLHKSICNLRPKPCLYCGAVMELYHLIQHEDTCGNRTEVCDICGAYVIIKQYPEHLVACSETENLDPKALKRKPQDLNPAKKRLKKLNNQND